MSLGSVSTMSGSGSGSIGEGCTLHEEVGLSAAILGEGFTWSTICNWK